MWEHMEPKHLESVTTNERTAQRAWQANRGRMLEEMLQRERP